MNSFTVVGHRGAAGLAPENTLASFRKAYELGVRLVEADVQLTADGVPILFHDDRLDRLTPERGSVRERTWEQLRELPVLPGSFGGAFPEARIPTLDDLLRGMPEDAVFVVELKPEPVRGEELVRRSLEAIRAAGVGERCRVISFDHDLLRLCRSLSTPPVIGVAGGRDLALGVLVSPRDTHLLLPVAREVRAEAVHAQYGTVDEALVQAARDGGFRINAWTVNSGDEALRFARMGVDEITTDYPDQVRPH